MVGFSTEKILVLKSEDSVSNQNVVIKYSYFGTDSYAFRTNLLDLVLNVLLPVLRPTNFWPYLAVLMQPSRAGGRCAARRRRRGRRRRGPSEAEAPQFGVDDRRELGPGDRARETRQPRARLRGVLHADREERRRLAEALRQRGTVQRSRLAGWDEGEVLPFELWKLDVRAHGTEPVAQVEQPAGLDAGEVGVQGGLLGS